jgi:hypothetical protein
MYCVQHRHLYYGGQIYKYYLPPSTNHRQFFTFFKDIKKYGADLVCGVPGQLKNIYEKILSQESMRCMRHPFSGRDRLGLT